MKIYSKQRRQFVSIGCARSASHFFNDSGWSAERHFARTPKTVKKESSLTQIFLAIASCLLIAKELMPSIKDFPQRNPLLSAKRIRNFAVPSIILSGECAILLLEKYCDGILKRID